MDMLIKYLSQMNGAGQCGNHRSLGRGCVAVLLMFALGFVGAGCGSIYKQTRAKLPPEPCAQLQYRVKEAQRAEKLAGQAVSKLRDRLNHGLSGVDIETDVDRVEVAAFELKRQAASARDATAYCEGQVQLTREIDRLHERARKLLESIQAVRRAGNSVSARQLDDLLQGSENP